jgi:hypothetical protein
MLAFAAQLGLVRRLFAVFAAVFAICPVSCDETLAGWMGAFVEIGHRWSPEFVLAFVLQF